MRDTTKLKEVLGDLAEQIEHGDYQRIANLSKKKGGEEPFTADYVRKVLFGIRQNKDILKKAKQYLKKKGKMTQELSS